VLSGSINDEGRAWDAVMALAQIKALPELVQAVVSKKTPSEAAALAAGRVLSIEPEHAGARKLLVESLTSRKVHVRGIAIDQMAEVGGAWAKVALDKLAHSTKGSELLEPIANALRTITAREKA
jgi:hypothetical protein